MQEFGRKHYDGTNLEKSTASRLILCYFNFKDTFFSEGFITLQIFGLE